MLLRLGLVALFTGAVVVLAGGGVAFMSCVPGVLVTCALTRSRVGAGLGTGAVMGAAGAATALSSRTLPAPVIAILVPIASAAVMVAVRERFQRERDALRRFALHDPLTGIGNRRLLLARAEYEIARHERTGRSFALVMLDLDGFKLLNDRFGHAAGDDLLHDLAASLTRAIRAQDTVARMGGDEFCVLAPETDQAGIRPLTARIAKAVGDTTVGLETLRASIGIALFPDDGSSPADLLHAADLRLIGTKRERHRGRPYRRAA